jgi:hypothetical protein
MTVLTRSSRPTLPLSSALSPFFGSSATEALDCRIEMRGELCWVADGVKRLPSQLALVLVQAHVPVSLGLMLAVLLALLLGVVLAV